VNALGVWRTGYLSALLISGASTAFAQTPASGSPRVQFEVGVAWTGEAALGSVNANLTAPDGSKFVLFSTSNEIGPTVGPDLRLGLRVTKRLRAEVTGGWSRADLRSRISGDFEGASSLTSTLRRVVADPARQARDVPARGRRLDAGVDGRQRVERRRHHRQRRRGREILVA
jgi:hypothetical protein